MVKVGEKYKSLFSLLIYTITDIEPKKILEIISEENPLEVKYLLCDTPRYRTLKAFEHLIKEGILIKI